MGGFIDRVLGRGEWSVVASGPSVVFAVKSIPQRGAATIVTGLSEVRARRMESRIRALNTDGARYDQYAAFCRRHSIATDAEPEQWDPSQ